MAHADAQSGNPLPLIGLLCLLTIPILSTMPTILAPALAQITDHFRGTPGADSLVRLLVTSAGGAMVLGAPAGGFLAERVGERQVLLGAMFLLAVSGTSGILLENPWMLIASRIGVGLAAGAIGVVAITLLLGGMAESGRNRWIGYYSLAATMGAVLLFAVAGYLAAIDWQLLFLLHLIALPLMVLVVLLIRKAPLHRSANAGSPASGAFPLGMLLLGLSGGIAMTTAITYLPFLFREFGEHDPSRVSMAISSSVAAGGLVAFFYGAIRRYLSLTSAMALGFLLVAVGMSVAALGQSFPAALSGMILQGLSIGLLGPSILSLAANAPPERRSRRVGLVRAGLFGAPLVAQAPLDLLSLAYGAAAAFLGIAGFAAAMVGVTFLSTRWLVRPA